MSQPGDRVIDAEDRARGRPDTSRDFDIPQSAQNQRHEPSDVSDGSGPIFNMYVKMAEEEDNKMTDRWQKDADGVLIFAGLFSAAVAALAAVSIQDLRPNSQDTSAFYLKNILQLLADPNVSRASILATSIEPPPFSPPTSAIWVNTLWFLSLVISLSCALLATSLQQWARRYVTNTQPPRFSPHRRARIRAFFRDGVEMLHLPLVVETLPTLLHVSLFLFLSGLLVFLFNINRTAFNAVVWWVGLLAILYGCITLMPIFYHDSPYYGPLSLPAWSLYTGVSYGLLYVLSFNPFPDLFSSGTRDHFEISMETYRKWFLEGISNAIQEDASKSSTRTDILVLKCTFDALVEDDDLEQFFSGIPGVCTSEHFHNSPAILRSLGYRRLGEALHVFHTRTLSSSFLSEMVRQRRLMVYEKAAEVVDRVVLTYENFVMMSYRDNDKVLQSVQMGNYLANRHHRNKGQTVIFAQVIVAYIIANSPKRDDHWKALVKDQFGVSKNESLKRLTRGDNALLANLLHITRLLFHHALSNRHMRSILMWILLQISKFDIQHTLPTLQHAFCALWNEITREAHNLDPSPDSCHIVFSVHRIIRHLYIALHQGTDAAPTEFDASTNSGHFVLSRPLSYPLCTIPGHHPQATQSLNHSFPVHPPDADMNLIAPAVPDLSSFSSLDPDHSRINFTEQPSPHGVAHATPIIQPSHLSPPVNVGNNDFATTIPDPPLTIATESHADTPVISPMDSSESDTRSAMVASTVISPSLPSSAAVDRLYRTDLDVNPPSMIPGVSSPPSPVPASSDTYPVDPLMPSARSPTSQLDLITPGSRLLMLGSVLDISFTSPQGTSDLQSNLSQSDATFNTHDNSLATDLSQPHLVDKTPPRDVDRPQKD